MSEHTFTAWLHTEVAAARCVLLKNYEQRDKLRYIDGPALEQKYMESIGEFERTVILTAWMLSTDILSTGSSDTTGIIRVIAC